MAVKLVSICPHVVERDVDAFDADHLLRIAAAVMAEAGACSADAAFRALSRREAAASTGLGAGVAVPHARLNGLGHRVTALLRTRIPVAFRAPDHKPVAIFYVILVPEDGNPDDHLAFLARVAAAFSDRSLRGALASAADDDAVKLAFVNWEEGQAGASPALADSRRRVSA
ncbi:MAG: PTS sugar transporter subunit IIA [Burkholderiales bacterium]|jgi:PTS system nitrogen regulatory IIA component|nr:PTS sugar transporter subunit IIA [Burkholderiales bacterium]